MSLYLGNNEISLDGVSEMYLGNDQVYSSGDPNLKIPLCFTAVTAGSTVQLYGVGSQTWSGYYSTDGTNWSEYTFGTSSVSDKITLSNVGDKVYFKGTGFSSSTSNRLAFLMTGSIDANGNIMSLSCGDNFLTTTNVPDYGFYNLFSYCKSLRDVNIIFTALSIGVYAYSCIFQSCTNMQKGPKILCTSLSTLSMEHMFWNCSVTTLPKLYCTNFSYRPYNCMYELATGIKLSETKTGEYVNEYRIPCSGTGIDSEGNATINMFWGTGGSFTGTPSINTTYYTSNEVIG